MYNSKLTEDKMNFSFYNTYRHDTYYQNPDYKLVEEYSPFLHKKSLTLQKIQSVIPSLTYRKIHFWSLKKLIPDSRETEKNWRKFSLVDVILLQIIARLRDISFSTEIIRAIIRQITNAHFIQLSKSGGTEKIRFLELEYSILRVVNGDKLLLILDHSNSDEPIRFVKEYLGIEGLLAEEQDAEFTILPVYAYIQTLARILGKELVLNEKDSVQEFWLKLIRQPTPQERKILNIIKDKSFDEVSIVKSGGEKFTVRAKSHQRGAFNDKDILNAINSRDYQNVTVATVGGEKISLTKEETIKV